MTKTLSEMRACILSAAAAAFYEGGVRATEVSTVVRRAAVSEASFFTVFRDKEDMATVWLESRDVEWRSWLDRRVQGLAATPKGRILAVFDALTEWFRSDEYRGCAFVNTAVEFPDHAHPTRRVCRAHKVSLRRYLHGLLREANVEPAERLASEFALLVDGAIISAVVEDDRSAARIARGAAARLLEDALRDGRGGA